jgi:hypothetical protein
VLFASYAHRENLVRAMLTGRKRQEEPSPATDPGEGSLGSHAVRNR